MNLPIDRILNTTPPRFRWRQVIDTPIGKKTVEHEGLVPPSMEMAVEALVMIAKQLNTKVVALTTENELLKKQVADLIEPPPFPMKDKAQPQPVKK